MIEAQPTSPQPAWRDRAYFIANALLFQALWFGCVIGAGRYQMPWVAILGALPLVILSLYSPVRALDWLIAAACVIVGTLIDNAWVATGILSYPGTQTAPLWISVLWIGLGLTVNHSLVWFRDAPIFGSIIVGLFAPVTYFAGERLGAVNVVEPWGLAAVALVWAVLFFALSHTATGYDRR